MKKLLFLLATLVFVTFAACTAEDAVSLLEVVLSDVASSATAKSHAAASSVAPSSVEIEEDGSYTDKDSVALYIHTYGKLPQNFITKKEAQALGWRNGPVEVYAPGKSIGGSTFGNYEKVLPVKKRRHYTECDIDTPGKTRRGAKRIIFSNDGLVYYTGDHYKTFTLLYGEE